MRREAPRLAPLRIAECRVDSDGRAARAAAGGGAEPARNFVPAASRASRPPQCRTLRGGAWRVGAPKPLARGTSSAPEARRRGADEVRLASDSAHVKGSRPRKVIAHALRRLAKTAAAAQAAGFSAARRRWPRRVA